LSLTLMHGSAMTYAMVIFPPLALRIPQASAKPARYFASLP